jgi:peptide deformylase
MYGIVSPDSATAGAQGDPCLKRPTARVEDTQEVLQLLGAMVDRLRRLNGAGLAAPRSARGCG